MGNTPQVPVPALGIVARDEKVAKGARVYVDASNAPRVSLADGRIGAVQREQRADGTLGPYMVALIRVSPDGIEGAQRFALADVQRLSDAYGAAGLALIAPYVAE